jgi:hypothetical protein
MIFPTKRFHGLHPVPDDVLAFFAFRRAKPDVALLAIRVSFVHRETDVVVLEFPVALERDATPPTITTTSSSLGNLAIDAGSQERISALGAEEMLFVVCALSELGVIQRDEALVHDGRLAVIAPRCEALEMSCSEM